MSDIEPEVSYPSTTFTCLLAFALKVSYINFHAQYIFQGVKTSSGILFKADPGVPLVYGGFLIVIVCTLLSFKDHEQVS